MTHYDHSKLPGHFFGLNSVNAAPSSAVRDFVAARRGHTVITSVLIANNGIAAVKEIRSVRRWAYQQFGDERAISFTVMATPEDLAANAEYIRMADQVVEVPGGTNNNNYANVDLIVDVAEQTSVQAVWAGWGHASENPLLPESLANSPKKIVFIGPPGSAMRSLGDKISSTIVAQHAKVPCIPWSGSGVDDVFLEEDTGLVSVKDEVYAQGCVTTAEEALKKAQDIGLPVMIKASEGGGGKGIRKVDREEDFVSLFHQVQSEIPGSPIFVMKLAGSARHLEVQLLADQYGNNISLFGRDCSVQRRHQKIIEEAPVDADVANPKTFEQMEQAAVRLGKLVGYVSAGTVEYLYSHDDDKFYFLELNPRLQVEHPTTEMVSGVNLPAAQLQVAMGIPLDFITDIRMLYGADPLSSRPLDFTCNSSQSTTFQRRPRAHGHTTACRITSEDPGAGFKPSGGTLSELNFRSSSNVWGYFSVGSRGNIHSFSDSQFGHIFAFGETREASRRSMVVALKELSIRGDFRTTVEYLISLLESEAFEKNTITTSWLDELISKKISTTDKPDRSVAVLCGAATRSYIESASVLRDYKEALERGQAPPKDSLKFLYQINFIYDGEQYRFTSTQTAIHTFRLFLNGSRADVGVQPLSDGGFLISINEKSHVVYYKDEVAGGTRLSVDGKTCLLEVENDPTQLRTPSPGKLVRFLVEPSEHISAGQPYAEVEVMKMYMPLLAQEDGIVQPIKQPGSQLVAGDIIGILALDDPSKVKHAKPHDGQLPAYGPPRMIGNKLDQQFVSYYEVLQNVMAGYDNQIVLSATFRKLTEVLRNQELPYAEWASRASALHSRLPPALDATLQGIVDRAHSKQAEFPSKSVLKTIAKWAPSGDKRMWDELVESLTTLAHDYSNGLEGHEYLMMSRLLQEYYDVEMQFNGQREEDVIHQLRESHKDDLDYILKVVVSHSRVGNKNNLMLMILNEYGATSSSLVATYLRPALKKIVELDGRPFSKVVLKAREVLICCALPSLRQQTEQMEHILRSSVMGSAYGAIVDRHRMTPRTEVLRELVESRYSVFDVLFQFCRHKDRHIAVAAMEVYARRVNRAYRVENIEHHLEPEEIPAIKYDFELTEASTPYTTTAGSKEGDLRHGVVCPGDYDDIDESISRVIELLPENQAPRLRRFSDPPIPGKPVQHPELINTANLIVFSEPDEFDESLDDETIMEHLREMIQDQRENLLKRSVRRITVLIQIGVGSSPKLFTFQGPNYDEHKTMRHVNPPMAFQLELGRLSNFHIRPVFSENRYIHMYEAHARSDPADKRFFLRTVITPERLAEGEEISTPEYLLSESNKLMNDILESLQSIDTSGSDLNHIFINFTAVFAVDPSEILKAFRDFLDRFGRSLWRLRVVGAEIRLVIGDPADPQQVLPIRALITNVSGFVVTTELYTEIRTESGEWVYKTLTGKPGNMHMRPVLNPYPTKEWLQLRRYEAHLKGTTFVYDYPELFKAAVKSSWRQSGRDAPAEYFKATELVLDEANNLTEVEREAGANTCGMVAWICTARTRECPSGRQFVMVANDITFKIGSFGPIEDKFFNSVTQLARSKGLPRVYLAANSGARLGIAEEVLPLLRAAWNDENDPEKGFNYLYLSADGYKQVGDSVSCTRLVENGEVRYRIDYVIGKSEGLGVESLRGSGLIAGATSRAYKDIFTVTIVTCRSVGIGAYLVRLGQRAIQIEGKPLLLTGADAINKLLARQVYASNLQLGGTQIMYKNGVSHLVAQDDYEGVAQFMEWLSFVPVRRDAIPPTLINHSDPWDRDVEFAPAKGTTYDVRHLIVGSDGERGLFDVNSWVETLGGWARGVVTGRARLGGIPFGVIGVETRPTESVYPADPANPLSTEQIVPEAGQVWYPNSAYKTAQAIQDFTNGEQLPIMILANWRGFSGGQRDMFFEVLKYGSYIVDALSECRQPVFVYIPPFGELRGGSWVVVDPSINPEFMEMYCDTDARAGVLEPEGLVGIKLRKPKLLAAMQRLDKEYAELCEQESDARAEDLPELGDICTAKIERENKLLPMYHQIAVQFAELHDRPGRMQAKGCVNGVIPWTNSRRFFYWRVRRRLCDVKVAREGGDLEALVPPSCTTDREVVEWFEGSDVAELLADIKAKKTARNVSEALSGSDIVAVLKHLTPECRKQLADHL